MPSGQSARTACTGGASCASARRPEEIGAVVDSRTAASHSARGGKHERSTVRRSTSPLLRVGALAAVAVIALGACGGRAGGSAAPAGSGGGAAASPNGINVNIAINPWVGYEADAAVVGYLMKNKLGYGVTEKNLKEEISWQGFESGDVDAILENWGHADLAKTYITDKKVAVDAGPTGNKGIIGWYVPPWLATATPDVLDWNNLNKYADKFKTTESGDKGQLLDGDPTFVTNDEALITNLKLNFKVVYAGSEATLIEQFRQAETQKKWLIGYFYEPQWFLAEVPLVRVKLPPYTDGCDADPKKVACDYPDYILNKIVSKKFADSGGAAYTLVKNFSWSNDDQNSVAASINGGKSHDDAAKIWVDANEAKWKAWIPGS
jgi:glycine betaine/proline transport system substrate-binding protein